MEGQEEPLIEKLNRDGFVTIRQMDRYMERELARRGRENQSKLVLRQHMGQIQAQLIVLISRMDKLEYKQSLD